MQTADSEHISIGCLEIELYCIIADSVAMPNIDSLP